MANKRLVPDPNRVCDALRIYRQEARDLLEHKDKKQEGLPAETVKKLRIMAVRKVPLAKMEERTGIPREKIWEVVSDADLTPYGKNVQLDEMNPDCAKTREIIQNGGDAKTASMQTGLPLIDAKRLEEEVIESNYRLLREQMMPTEGPSLGEFMRMRELHNKRVDKRGISARTGYSPMEVGEILKKYEKMFPLTRPARRFLVRDGSRKKRADTPNEAILGVSRQSPSLIDISKVFQERYGGEKRKTVEETAKALGISHKTVQSYLTKYRPLFPEYLKKKSG